MPNSGNVLGKVILDPPRIPERLGYLFPVSKIYSPPDFSTDGPQMTSAEIEVRPRNKNKIGKLEYLGTNVSSISPISCKFLNYKFRKG